MNDERQLSKKIPAIADLNKLGSNFYEIRKDFRSDMRVPARFLLKESMLKESLQDRSFGQLVNVTTLPGIVNYAVAMPDMHQGYGFPIGGVAATDIHKGGVISPGGIGYDINCGVRLLASYTKYSTIKSLLEDLADALFAAIPSGMGHGGKLKLSDARLDRILKEGARAALAMGYGNESDLIFCEENGCMDGAEPHVVSDQAKKRGHGQLGTLGSGNHFLEVQRVDKIFDPEAAAVFGLEQNQITVMIHCGSRGLGHQVCTDYVRRFIAKIDEWGIVLPDRELVCAPFLSSDGQDYYKAMQAAANFAWANRQVIAHNVRQAWKSVVGRNDDLRLVYDVSHNMAKREYHVINGKERELLVHRKGATRAFGQGRMEVPAAYRHIGQPVLIPGTMGTASYVLAGNEQGMEIAFGSSCHGAGRRMSRMEAQRVIRGSSLRQALASQGIVIRCASDSELAQEGPEAYKDVEEVVDVIHDVGVARRVARLVPIIVIKGD